MDSVETRYKNKQRIKTNQCAPGWARNSGEKPDLSGFFVYNILMVTEQQLNSKIKKAHILNCIGFMFAMLVFPVMYAMPFVFSGIERAPIEMIVAVSLIGVIFTVGIDGYILRKHLLPEIRDVKNVTNDPIFRAFDSMSEIVRILNEIEATPKIYEHNNVKLVKDYIVDMGDYRTLMRLADVTHLGIGMDAHDTDGSALMVRDKFDRICRYSISGDKNAAIHLGDLVIKHCPSIKNKHEFEQQSQVEKL